MQRGKTIRSLGPSSGRGNVPICDRRNVRYLFFTRERFRISRLRRCLIGAVSRYPLKSIPLILRGCLVTFKFEEKQSRITNRSHAELLPRLIRIATHSVFTDLQVAGDFFRTPVLSKPLQNFFFSRRQRCALLQ